MGGMLSVRHRSENAQTLKSEEISQDIEALERDLSGLRARVEKDSSSFATLEQEVAQLRENLLRTRESVAEHEARLSNKQKELGEAKRLEALEAYEAEVRSQHEAADRAAGAATDLLAALDAYDDETLRLRQLVEQMRRAFGSDERVAEVEAALGDEAARLRATSEAVLAATKWRLDVVADEEATEPEEAEEDPAEEELSQDLQEIAQERRRARIKEYFGKS
jgi:predicted  nucleic acid-binding Zn-ribbon protein